MNIKKIIAREGLILIVLVIWIFLLSGCAKFSMTDDGKAKWTVPFDFPQKKTDIDK